MKVLIINSVCGIGSTGKICADIANEYDRKGYEVKIAYGRDEKVPEDCKKYAVMIGNKLDLYTHVLITRLFDLHGFGSKISTRRFIKWAEKYDPDIVWLHNIHGYFINIEYLFKWIKSRPALEVKWTLHDCWAFTGHCAYFTYIQCDKWKKLCNNCPQRFSYPRSFFRDNSLANYKKKQSLFCGVNNMTIITPSKWLEDLVNKSFLKMYPTVVINNIIDKKIFRPTYDDDINNKLGVGNRRIILGVANKWDERKGFNDFLELAQFIDDTYVIVLVGLNNKQIKLCSNKIIGITRTFNQVELAEIYTAAYVFFNPTKEENYPTVNLEAEACGTPVVTYNTGGCAETIHNTRSMVVNCLDDFIELLNKNSF